ncbi:MAG: PAS domain S-box protein [Nitrospirae bacterium]|nr:PAS domain S-box protein [Nitrospirota bacterium]
MKSTEYKRALDALLQCNKVIRENHDEPLLLKDVCRVIVQDVGYRLAWIGYKEDDHEKRVLPVSSYGFSDGYIERAGIVWAETERGLGPTGASIRSEKPVICQNMTTDEKFKPWRDEAIKRGYASSIALPLAINGVVIGALNIYALNPDAFNDDEVELLQELTESLSFGISHIRQNNANKEITHKLNESEEKYKSIFNEANMVILIINPDTLELMDVNNKACHFYGYSKDEFLKKRLPEIQTLPEEKLHVIASEVMGKNRSYLVTSHRTSSGEVRDVEIHTGPITIQGKDYICSTINDITERKRMEEEIKVINHNLQRKIDDEIAKNEHMMNGYAYCEMIYDENGNPADFIYLEVNRSFETLTGLKREDVINKKVTGVIPLIKEKHPELIEAYGRVASGGGAVNLELLFEPINVWLNINIYSPKKGYFVAIFDNTTERKNMETGLRDSEEKYRLLFTHENDAILLCDAETLGYIDSNDAWNKQYGYTNDEMRGKSVIIISAEPEKSIEIRNEALISGSARVPQRLHRRKDGTLLSVELSVGVFTYKGRKVLCVISRDITHKLRIEAQNEYNARLFDIIFEHVMDSIVLLDKDFNYIRVSKSYVNVCQRDEAELTGRNHFEMYPSSFQLEAQETKRRKVPYAVSERPFTFPDHPEWGITYWDVRLVPVLDKDFEVEMFLYTLKDVTKQKLNKDALTALNETLMKRVNEEVEKSRIKDQLMYEQSRHTSMGELLVNISHHWRQPLCSIGLSVQDIKDAYFHKELDELYLNKTIDFTMSELKSLSDTIDSFRNFHVRDKEPKEFNISDEINKAYALISEYIKERGILIDKELDGSLTAWGCPNEFAQVILNILTNARDSFERANFTGGIIRIKLYRDGTTGRKIITIANNGGGIHDDIINKVFDPYFTTKDKSRGTGMGLYLAKVIIEKDINGTISIRNIDGWCELRIEL